MADLDRDKIKKLKRGEAVGYVFAAVCIAAVIYFIVCFSIAQVKDLYSLRLAVLISAPIILLLGASVSAYCNLVYGRELDRQISKYIREVFIENAAAMHPERNSLTFHFLFEDSTLEMKTNGYTEKVIFDFSPFGKLSALKISSITSECINRLTTTFCRLFDRGAGYIEVGYVFDRNGKKGKECKIISGGIPDGKAYKDYIKTK